jgi:hypothetical protein
VRIPIALLSLQPSNSPRSSQISFLANIVQSCIQRGRVATSAAAASAQDAITAALAKTGNDACEFQFVGLAGEIEKQSESWGHLLLRLQQKHTGELRDSLSESVSGLHVKVLMLIVWF